jgi:hypothetical protein
MQDNDVSAGRTLAIPWTDVALEAEPWRVGHLFLSTPYNVCPTQPKATASFPANAPRSQGFHQDRRTGPNRNGVASTCRRSALSTNHSWQPVQARLKARARMLTRGIRERLLNRPSYLDGGSRTS